MKKILLAVIGFMAAATSFGQLKGVENVVLIGTDGFGAFTLKEHPEMFPNIMALAQRGSSSLEVRSVLPSSSAVNWASILMGAGPELHGYTEWGSPKPDLEPRVLSHRGMFPGIFGLVKDKYPNAEMGVLYSWDGIGKLFDTTAVNYNVSTPNDSTTTVLAVKYLAEKKPKFSFFYLAEPDGVGHNIGWKTDEYYAMCRKIDAYVGEIIAGINAAGMAQNTVVIFVADHGGIDKGHGGKTMQEMQVPYIIAGKGIKKGHKITESQMIYDNAAVIARIFGIDKPQVWIARAPESIFE